MWKPIAAALALTAAGAAAAASFEGIIDSRITFTGDEEHGAGTTRLYVAGEGLRIEGQATAALGSVKATTLFLRSKPRVTYFIDDEKKTYTELERLDDPASQNEPEKVSLKKLPGERVAGYDCAHALLLDERGESTEVWVSKAIGGAEAFWAAQTGGRGSSGRQVASTLKALRAAGIDGWPLKWKTHPARTGSGGFAWEATKVERKKLPPSLFSLSGYTRSDGGPGAIGVGETQLSPQQQRKLREAMEKVPPERRKQVEELLNAAPGGGGGNGKGD